MEKKLIIVTGYLAAGKSTFAARLSQDLGIPCLIKDTFKSALCRDISFTDRGESSRFSAVTFYAMMYVTQQMMAAGYPLILEGNFMPAGIKKTDEAGEIASLAAQYGYETLTFKFTGDTAVLHQRFILREDTSERDRCNRLGSVPTQREFDLWCHNMDNFYIGGEMVTVNTTDFGMVDFPELFRIAETFIHR